MSGKRFQTPCGGCGQEYASKRCIGCHHEMASTSDLASSQAEIERLRTALRSMLSRFELYAGENDQHAGHHDKALLDEARATLSGSKP
jgi:hypothetical protein